jgi:hypothetical protein
MVFIRATIIKDPDRAHMLSYKKYNFMRDLQLKAMSGELNQIPPALVPYEGPIVPSERPRAPIVETPSKFDSEFDSESTIVPIDK